MGKKKFVDGASSSIDEDDTDAPVNLLEIP